MVARRRSGWAAAGPSLTSLSKCVYVNVEKAEWVGGRRGVTHCIVGGGTGRAARRTLKVLRCLLRGCWLLSFDWVADSLAAGRLLEVEEYEIQVGQLHNIGAGV